MKKVRVLIVDDSAFMRKAIRRMLSKARYRGGGYRGRRTEALAKVGELRPDIITLDVKMAGMDGITALEHIMREYATPVIMPRRSRRKGPT
jgi:two-component system chemotaxis response regulator CheB